MAASRLFTTAPTMNPITSSRDTGGMTRSSRNPEKSLARAAVGQRATAAISAVTHRCIVTRGMCSDVMGVLAWVPSKTVAYPSIAFHPAALRTTIAAP